MSPILATYENGVFRPLTAVDLPEHCEVFVTPKQRKAVDPLDSQEGLDEIYEILDRRHSSGYSHTAERHNEHEP